VPQPVRVHAGDAGGPGDAGNDAADDVAVERAAVVGDQPAVPADVLNVACDMRRRLSRDRSVVVTLRYRQQP
jgi:hypothetical protein